MTHDERRIMTLARQIESNSSKMTRLTFFFDNNHWPLMCFELPNQIYWRHVQNDFHAAKKLAREYIHYFITLRIFCNDILMLTN